MRFWIGEHSGKVARATRPGLGGNSDLEIATADGWTPGSVDLAHDIFGPNMDWDEVTPARAHAQLVSKGYTKAAAAIG